MRTVIVNGDGLTVQDVIEVSRGQARAELGPDVPARMEVSREVVAAAIAGDAPVYGVNTGFGALADTRVGEQDLRTLQGAIVMSHAAGTGEPLDDATVRAILLLRARTLAAGYSGVRPDLPRRLLELLDLGLLPVIPGKGSVGASGDLAQLAHLAQPLIGEGRLRGPATAPDGRPGRRRSWPSTGSSRCAWRPRRGCRWSTGPSRCRRCWRSRCTKPRCWSRRPTSPARCRWRRCSATTGPTTSGCRRSGRTRASWTARPTCARCWPARR